MPCVEFNNFVGNGTFKALMYRCHAGDVYEWLLDTTTLVESAFYGYEYCQKIHPDRCMYQETEPCSGIDRVYNCAMSRWLYAANFMLLWTLDPTLAAKMPDCRIVA